VNELLLTKEKNIIDFIENQFTNDSTIKCKLCSVYKSYKTLNVKGKMIKNKIDFYAVKKIFKKTKIKKRIKKVLKKVIPLFPILSINWKN
jgi:hypothetical protein